MAKKDNFLLSIKHAKRINGLSDEDAGKLLKSIFAFAGGDNEGEYELSERADLIFDYIKEEIEEASKKYDEVCEKRRIAASSRGKNADADAQDDTNANKCKQKQAKADNNDNDSECDSECEHNSLKESMCVDDPACTNEDRASLTPCGFFQNVYLAADEIKKLEAEYGESKLKKAITLLSARIQKDGKYKDDNHAALIVQWVMRAVDEDEVKELELKNRKTKARGSPGDDASDKVKKAGFDITFEDIYEKTVMR